MNTFSLAFPGDGKLLRALVEIVAIMALAACAVMGCRMPCSVSAAADSSLSAPPWGRYAETAVRYPVARVAMLIAIDLG